jgi:hypothetical protein
MGLKPNMTRYVTAVAAGSLFGIALGGAFFMLQLELTDGYPQHLPPKGKLYAALNPQARQTPSQPE